MKTFINSSLLTILLVALAAYPAFSQTHSQINLQKYWFYRHRLKDFVVVGNCQGCSLPSGKRFDNTLDFSDEIEILGEYIGMLAVNPLSI